jgi:hypothetical protein
VKKQDEPPPIAARALAARDPFGLVRPPSDPASLRQPDSPYDSKLSLAAIAWMSELPQEVAPLVLANQFPRIVNRLSRFWDSPRMMDDYFQQLLMDRRSKRKGFPKKILDELYALAEHYRALHKSSSKSDLWESIPYRKAHGA